jgi:BRICHOS domain.
MTGIVDVAGQRCFVMPLDRSVVLPPASLHDLLQKMQTGKTKHHLIIHCTYQVPKIILFGLFFDNLSALGEPFLSQLS